MTQASATTKRSFNPDEVLLGYQSRWIQDPSPLKIAEKSRRTGFTWAQAADDVLTASMDRKAGGSNCFYVGSNKEMAREFIDACAMWAKVFNRAASDIGEEIYLDDKADREILTFVVHFPESGFKVQALSSRPSNLRGMQGNVTIDEAAFHALLAEVLKAALALTMWGAKVRLISTHNGVDSLFNELINDSRAGRKRYSVHRVTLDDACNEGLFQRICQRKGEVWTLEKENQWKADLLRDTASEEDALEEYYCVPKRASGAYISRTLIEAAMPEPRPVLRFECSTEFNQWPERMRHAEVQDWLEREVKPLLAALPADCAHAAGMDFGRSIDLSAIAPITTRTQLDLSVPFLLELRNMPFKQQEQVLFYVLDRLPRFNQAILDARGNGSYLAEEAQYRYGSERVQKLMASSSWYIENMPRFKARFENNEITLPKDAEVLADIQALRLVNGVPKLPEGNTAATGAKKRHGDAAMALVYGVIAAQAEVVLIEYQSASAKHLRDEERDIRQTVFASSRCCL